MRMNELLESLKVTYSSSVYDIEGVNLTGKVLVNRKVDGQAVVVYTGVKPEEDICGNWTPAKALANQLAGMQNVYGGLGGCSLGLGRDPFALPGW